MQKLSDYVIRFIADQGVRHVFLVTGGGAMHLNDSLARLTAIEAICNSHEQASAIAAENYAKATNNLGVALVTTGPGGTNAVTGVAGAWLDSTPCLFLSGQVKRPDRMFHSDGSPRQVRQLGIQEVDIVSIVRPITKYAVTVLDPQTIRFHLEKAVYLARSGRPGPVWVDIPLDVQGSPIDPDSLAGFHARKISGPRRSELSDRVRLTIDALNHAERPLLFAGNGIRLSKAEAEFEQLAEILGIPVATTWCASDLIDSAGELHVGSPGAIAPRYSNFVLQNCDFLLAVGARLDFAITGYAPERLARAAHKVVVDIDPAELAKLHPNIQTPVCADAGAFLKEMLAQRSSIEKRDRACWRKRCTEWKKRYPLITADRRAPGRVSVYHLAEVIADQAAPDDLLVCGSSGTAIEMFLLAFRGRAGQRVYHTAGLGAMGFGLPAAIGVCLAGGRCRTICIEGDGGFQFNIQELETVARLNLPIKFFVLNNGGYASIRASQSAYFGGPNLGCTPETGLTLPDVRKVAAAYGLPTAAIENQSKLCCDVREVLDSPGPVVCDVKVVPDEVRSPRLASTQRPDGSFVSRPLEDLWPFLERDEFLANMIVPPLQDSL